jgi:CheY-like chemotaxis protein
VTDFIDLQAILRTAQEDFLNAPVPATLLLADSSPFNRGLLRNQFEMAGYRVIEAATSLEIAQRVEEETVNLLIAGLNLISSDPPAMERVRRAPGAAGSRLIGLVNSPDEIELTRALHPEFDDYQVRYETEAMLRSVERLAQSLDHQSRMLDKKESGVRHDS